MNNTERWGISTADRERHKRQVRAGRTIDSIQRELARVRSVHDLSERRAILQILNLVIVGAEEIIDEAQQLETAELADRGHTRHVECF
jgi:hypothetical protein